MEEKDLMNKSGDSVKISEEVIAVITGIAVSETEGVVSVGAGGIASGWAELISGKKNNSKGIKIEMAESEVNVEVAIVVKYGVNIPEIAANVQINVKNSIEEMTGLNVNGIDVKIVGIKTEAQEKKNPENKEKTKEKE